MLSTVSNVNPTSSMVYDSSRDLACVEIKFIVMSLARSSGIYFALNSSSHTSSAASISSTSSLSFGVTFVASVCDGTSVQ